MKTSTLEERQQEVIASERALAAEVADMEFRLRALSFDAVSDAKAKTALLALEGDLDTRRRLLALTRVALAEGERRLAVQSEEEATGKRAALAAERIHLREQRDQVYYRFEEAIEGLIALVGSGQAVDFALRNVEHRLDAPSGALATDMLGMYAEHHLGRAGMRFGRRYHDLGGRPISERRTRELREAEIAQTRAQSDEAEGGQQ